VLTDPLNLCGQVLLGRYRVDAAIAKGGMSVIYRGRDFRLLRPVCIKIFQRLSRSDAAHRTSYEHFVQEAFALSQLSHPNTLRIYDFGHLENDTEAPFQVSELLEGGTLAQWVRREGKRRPEEVLAIIEPIAGALAEAHSRGIVHRDIKPSNIIIALLGARRVAKLADFGIAKAHGVEDGLPVRAGDTLVTAGQPMRLYSPGWAAPEQIRGEPASAVADVFSLGLVTAYMLGGRPIFSNTDEEAEFDQRVESNTHVDAAIERMGVSSALAEFLRKTTRENASERYQSAEEFAQALRKSIAGGFRDEHTSPEIRIPVDSNDALGLSGPLLLPVDDTCESYSAVEAVAAVTQEERFMGGSGAVGGPRLLSQAPLSVVDVRSEVRAQLGVRQIHMLPLEGEQLELGGADSGLCASQARFRITLLPSTSGMPRINVKGLNCFVAKHGGRAAAAVDVGDDVDIDLLSPARKKLDGLRVMIGRNAGDIQLLQVGTAMLSVRGAGEYAILIDVGPGRELLLVHRQDAALLSGGQP
jgi:serine/threonine protein kinase